MKAFIITLLLFSFLLCAQEQATLESILREDVQHLANSIGTRNSYEYEKLQETVAYIKKRMEGLNLELQPQEYEVKGKKYVNLAYEKLGKNPKNPIIVVGAHYDTAYGTPGADDNGSGVAVLLSLSKLFQDYKNKNTIRFVFFTLEEPPFFRSSNMGSTVYAGAMKEKKEQVKLMISLETLGCYSDKIDQSYPDPALATKYPRKGDFVAVVSNYNYANQTKHFFEHLNLHNTFSTQLLIAPSALSGVDFSDHLSFWLHGYPALMITDTAFYRNKNYHKATDLPETLDCSKMASLTEAIYQAVKAIDN